MRYVRTDSTDSNGIDGTGKVGIPEQNRTWQDRGVDNDDHMEKKELKKSTRFTHNCLGCSRERLSCMKKDKIDTYSGHAHTYIGHVGHTGPGVEP